MAPPVRSPGIFLGELAEQAGLQKQSDQVAEVIKVLDRFGKNEKRLAQGVVRGLSKGLAKSRSPLLAQFSGPDVAGGAAAGPDDPRGQGPRSRFTATR